MKKKKIVKIFDCDDITELDNKISNFVHEKDCNYEDVCVVIYNDSKVEIKRIEDLEDE
jgi:hypothetical protein